MNKITNDYLKNLKSCLLINEDCIRELEKMDDNIFDSVVIDPPYAIDFLGKEWDCFDEPLKFQEWCTRWASQLLRVTKPGGHLLSFGSTRTFHRMVAGLEDAHWKIRDTLAWIQGQGFPKSKNLANQTDKLHGCYNRGHAIATASKFHPTTGQPLPSGQNLPRYQPRTEFSKDCEGWETGLKPAMELICLARKRLSEKSIAENFKKWGTGGLNVDACLIPFGTNENTTKQHKEGRWPANVMLDDEAGLLMNLQADANVSRFFYCPKPSNSEKNAGLEELPKTRRDLRAEKAAGVMSKKSVQPQQNSHPTIKPVGLLRYLCRLITPQNGVVLDCFMGSGSCGIAAVLEGFKYVGIEKNKPFVDIAELRLKHWLKAKAA